MRDTKYLEEIKARCKKATTGEWIAFEDEIVNSHENARGARYTPIVSRVKGRECWLKHEDAEFIAHSRTDIPALLAEVERLQKEVWKKELAFGQLTHYNSTQDKQIATLKKALELMVSSLRESNFDCRDVDYFIQQAQKQEGKNDT